MNPKQKDEIVSRSYLLQILHGHLKIPIETFNTMTINEIKLTSENDLIVQYKNPTMVGYLYSQTKNLNPKSDISFNDYIPAEFYRRHRELNAISHIIREKKNVYSYKTWIY
jgi:hypothetical protein